MLDALEAVRWVHGQSFSTTYWKDILVQNKLMIDDLLVFSEHFPALRQAIKDNHLLTKRYFYSARLSWQRKKYGDASIYLLKSAKDIRWIKNRVQRRMRMRG